MSLEPSLHQHLGTSGCQSGLSNTSHCSHPRIHRSVISNSSPGLLRGSGRCWQHSSHPSASVALCSDNGWFLQYQAKLPIIRHCAPLKRIPEFCNSCTGLAPGGEADTGYVLSRGGCATPRARGRDFPTLGRHFPQSTSVNDPGRSPAAPGHPLAAGGTNPAIRMPFPHTAHSTLPLFSAFSFNEFS